MKKKMIMVSLASLIALSSFTAVFADSTMEVIEETNEGYTITQHIQNDAQRESGEEGITPYSYKVTSDKVRRTKVDAEAPVGMLFQGWGWTDVKNGKTSIKHSTTVRLEFSDETIVATSPKVFGTGKVEAQTDWVTQGGDVRVYYDY